MPSTPSRWLRFRREFSQWADQRDQDPDVTQRMTASVPPLVSAEKREFDLLINDYRSRDSWFDWAKDGAAMADRPPLFAEGQLIGGRFQIVRFLGRGGMGEVYEATNQTLQGSRRVALKILNAELRQRPDATRRFLREVELAQRVTHPNICRINDIFPFALVDSEGGETEGHFLTMQLLQGESLAKYIRDVGVVRLKDALPILRALAEALDAAHSENVIHRDLKPANIILVKRAGALQPIITDFGLAALADRTIEVDNEKSLADFTRAGTPEYSAPEQLQDGRSGPGADIYSLGVVALEMLTGKTAPSGIQTLPPEARKAITRCLEFEPSARFARAPDFIAALAGEPLDNRKSNSAITRRAAIAVAAAAVSTAALSYFETFRTGGHNLNTLSILPFELASPGASMPGFQEELVRTFLRSQRIKLIAPYSTSSLHAPFDVNRLSKILPSDAFLLGIISTASILVQLFRKNGTKLWEKSFSRAGSGFELHRTVVASVLSEVAGAADARAVTAVSYVPSEESYRAYIAGRAAIRGQTPEDLSQAEKLFLESIHHDGAFAEAFSGLGYVLFLMGGNRLADARAALARAQELDPSSAEAHMVKSMILHRCDWDWSGAVAEVKKALDLEPYNFIVHQAYGGFLSDRGLFAEGLPEIQAAVDYDPFSYTAKFALGIMSGHARRFDFAIRQLEDGIRTAKSVGVEVSRPYNYLGACWLKKGDRQKAYSCYQQGMAVRQDGPTLCHFIYGAAGCGYLDEARSKMNQLLQMPEASEIPFQTGLAFAGLGDVSRSLDYLDAAFTARDPDIVTAKVHLYCDSLQAEPRYQSLLQRMQLA